MVNYYRKRKLSYEKYILKNNMHMKLIIYLLLKKYSSIVHVYLKQGLLKLKLILM